MKEEISKRLLLNFEEYLKQKIEVYCQRHAMGNDTNNFIIFLVDKGLVNVATVK